jgi:hypothetical protein
MSSPRKRFQRNIGEDAMSSDLPALVPALRSEASLSIYTDPEISRFVQYYWNETAID